MARRASGKMFNRAFLHFEKRESQKDEDGEKASEIIFTMKSTIIIGISFLTLLISLLGSC